jgi:hypothetical protein
MIQYDTTDKRTRNEVSQLDDVPPRPPTMCRLLPQRPRNECPGPQENALLEARLYVINLVLFERNLVIVVATVRGVLLVDLCRIGEFTVLLQVSGLEHHRHQPYARSPAAANSPLLLCT